jgi:murein DD-endopeptidase MepM/ murein hydrolase activator NlpD
MTSSHPSTRRTFIAAVSAAAVGGLVGAWRVGASGGSPRIEQGADALAPAVRMTTTTTTLPPPPRGKIYFPMAPGSRCTVLDNFGDGRPVGCAATGSCTRRHEGVDILGELGLECIAVDNGVVTRKEIHSTAGLMLNFETEDGTYYSYQHLSEFAANLEIGVPVTRGQVIGYVGDTGNPGVGNYHLHFEWHPADADGAARDPFDRLLIPDSCIVY